MMPLYPAALRRRTTTLLGSRGWIYMILGCDSTWYLVFPRVMGFSREETTSCSNFRVTPSLTNVDEISNL